MMGIKERREGERVEMRKSIMQAAVAIIEQEGYERLSIRKIAAKIEYSPTTIYLYYKDKADIIADMSGVLYGKVAQRAAAIMQEGGLPAEESVRRGLLAFIESLCGEPEMAKAIMYSGENVIFANENAGGVPGGPGIAMLEEQVARGIAQGAFRPDIAGCGWMIISALLGFVMSAIENRLYLLEDFSRMAERFVGILVEGMGKTNGEQGGMK